MKKPIKTLLLFLLGFEVASASRISEVEDYYSERAASFIKRRFPDQPFTVVAKVDVAETGNKKEDKSASLPYLEVVDKEVDIWNRADLPLSTLISYVDRVEMKIEIAAKLDANELNSLHNQLFEYLKLSTASDKIEIKKMELPPATIQTSPTDTTNWFKLLSVLGTCLLVGFMLVSQWNVRSLIKGLSRPISEIGKSTKTFAENSLALSQSSRNTAGQGVSQSIGMRGDSSYEARRIFKEVFQDNVSLFAHPDCELIDFIENEGNKNPHSISALFSELPPTTVKNLFTFGYGTWWYKSLSSAPVIDEHSIQFIYKLNQFKIKNQFLDTKKLLDSQIKDLALILNRLSIKQAEEVFQSYSLKELQPILQLLPNSKSLQICKSLFPGEWAQFLNVNSTHSISTSVALQIQKKALKVFPLRDLKTIDNYYRQMELEKYLDMAKTRDERDFYRTLPSESPIKQERLPFYSLFEQEDDVFKQVVSETSIHDWALVLKDCERQESTRVFDCLSERQRYFLRELLSNNTMIDQEQKMLTKKQIVQNLQNKLQLEQMIKKENEEEKAA